MSTDPVFMKVGGNYYWYHNDHLGTPQMMTTSSGAVVWSAKYTSFLEANIDASSIIINNLRAPGQYFDAETGLYYNYNRYYNQKSGRYLRTDPIGFAGGINIFIYTKNNPMGYIDPYGLKILTPKWFPGVHGLIKNAKGLVSSVSENAFTKKEMDELVDKIWEVGEDSQVIDFGRYQPLIDQNTGVKSYQFTKDQLAIIEDLMSKLKQMYPDDLLVQKALREWEKAKNKWIFFEKNGLIYCIKVIKCEGGKYPCPKNINPEDIRKE